MLVHVNEVRTSEKRETKSSNNGGGEYNKWTQY